MDKDKMSEHSKFKRTSIISVSLFIIEPLVSRCSAYKELWKGHTFYSLKPFQDLNFKQNSIKPSRDLFKLP